MEISFLKHKAKKLKYNTKLNPPQVCSFAAGCRPTLTSYLLQGESFLRRQPALSQSRNSPHFMKPEGHYRIHKCQLPAPILSQIGPGHAPTPHFLKIHLNISSYLHLGLPSVLFPPVFPTKTLYKHLLSQYVLHAPPIAFFSIWAVDLYE